MADSIRRLGTIYLLAVLVSTSCNTLQDYSKGQLTIPQSPLLKKIERKSGLIAFLGTDGNIYTMNQAGEKVEQVTNDAEFGDEFVRYYSHVTWAPDGQHIAYVSYSGTSSQNVQAHLYVSQSSGERSREIFSSDRLIPVFLYWAPNSQMLSFLAMQTDGNHAILHIVPVDGGETRVMDTGQPLYWVWTPSATRMLIHSNGARAFRPDARLALLSLDEPVVEEGLDLRPAIFQAPEVSPSGGHMLIAAETEDGDSALMILDMEEQSHEVIALTDKNIAFDWSPDGRHICYVTSDHEGYAAHGPLTVVDVGTDTNKLPLTVGRNIVAFFWSPDGKRVALFETDNGMESLEQSETEMRHLLLHILDVESGEIDFLFSFLPSEQFASMLPYIDQYQRTYTVWSPDSEYLAIAAYTQSGPTIVVAQADKDYEPRVLHPGTLAVWSWQ